MTNRHIAYNHAHAALAAGREWTCGCAACTALRAEFARKRARKEAARRHQDLLIAIMVLRSAMREPNRPDALRRDDQRRLADLQFQFEKLMVRKLKLHRTDVAAVYGFTKPKPNHKPTAPETL